MTTGKLIRCFRDWQSQGRSLVLATVTETEGSTYSKAGARMLITDDGKFQGMLSGGCLEGDLAERAARVLASGEPSSVTYDLGSNDEELWGLGVGCDGLMRIFLQAITPAGSYEPFAAMVECLAGNVPAITAMVVESDADGVPPGATLVSDGRQFEYSDIDPAPRADLRQLAEKALLHRESRTESVNIGAGKARILFGLLKPPPRLLVLGAGLDAEPVARLADELGWRVVVQDHRPAYIENGDFAGAEKVMCMPAHSVAENLPLDQFDAAIVMSHHLATDRIYLAMLAGTSIAYIGLLGPEARKNRLISELMAGSDGEMSDLGSRVHGPAGLDLGGRGPAAIALSIVAEIHHTICAIPAA